MAKKQDATSQDKQKLEKLLEQSKQVRERALARGYSKEDCYVLYRVGEVKPDGVNFHPGRDYTYLFLGVLAYWHTMERAMAFGGPNLKKMMERLCDDEKYRERVEREYQKLLVFTSSDLKQYAPCFTEFLAKYGKVGSELERIEEPFMGSKNLETAIQCMENAENGIGSALENNEWQQYKPCLTEPDFMKEFRKIRRQLRTEKSYYMDPVDLEGSLRVMENVEKEMNTWSAWSKMTGISLEDIKWHMWSIATGITLEDMKLAKAWGYDKIRKEEHIVYVGGTYAGQYSVFLDPREPGIRGNYGTIEIEGKPYSVCGHTFVPSEQFARKTEIGKLGARLEFATSNDWGYASGPHLLMKRQDDFRHIPFP